MFTSLITSSNGIQESDIDAVAQFVIKKYKARGDTDLSAGRLESRHNSAIAYCTILHVLAIIMSQCTYSASTDISLCCSLDLRKDLSGTTPISQSSELGME